MAGKLNGQGDIGRRWLTRLVLMVSAASVAALGAPAGAAAGRLDQYQTSSPGSSPLHGATRLAQTFTAGPSGQLDQVDVDLGKSCNASGVTVELRTVSADGKPTNTTLASALIPDTSVPGSDQFVSATFSAPASVVGGTQYAIVLSAPTSSPCTSPGNPSPYHWGYADGDPYPLGEAVYSPDGGTSWTPRTGYDNSFKTYVVDPPPPDSPPPDGTTPPPDGTTPPSDGTTPPPISSEYTRTVSLDYSKNKNKFKGTLASQSPACVAGQKVKVFERQKGKDPKLGSDASFANGKYSLKEKNAEGKFYAKVRQSSISGGTCLAAKSETIKVN